MSIDLYAYEREEAECQEAEIASDLDAMAEGYGPMISREAVAEMWAAAHRRHAANVAEWEAESQRIAARRAVVAAEIAEEQREREEHAAWVMTFTPAEWCARFARNK
jgi:acid stress-induced BolA-like protein IbaG/YrbA